MESDVQPRVQAGQVWVLGEPIRGLICISLVSDALFIENVAVHPGALGTGLGRKLMGFAEPEARRCGVGRLTLYTNEVMTENLAIYSHLGYEGIDRHTDGGYRRVFMEKAI
jgi:GNAT superfamily N-acetyltransferase